jgi:hypothetical protein
MFACSEKHDNKSVEKLEALNALFGKALITPMVLDSTYLFNADTTVPINYRQIRAWQAESQNTFFADELAMPLNAFCKIDSLKQCGQYGKYVDSLDIGMVQSSSAYVAGKMSWATGSLFLFTLNLSSYEACPSFSGNYAMAVFMPATGKMQLCLLAKYFTGIDPPVYSCEKQVANINNTTIKLQRSFLSDEDMDVSGYQYTAEEFDVMAVGDSLTIKKH